MLRDCGGAAAAAGAAADAPESLFPLIPETEAGSVECAGLLCSAGTSKCIHIPAPEPHIPPPVLSLLAQINERDEDDEPATHGVGIRDISFVACKFLCTEFMTTMRQDDVKYLEDQGCLQVPRHEIMDEMLTQFFRHVQPVLPLFDEALFWTQYHSVESLSYSEPTGDSKNRISLFLLQSMLFASCSFINASTLISLGFRNIRHARKCFYRRARLLYCLETVNYPLTLAQGCLLLTMLSSHDDDKQINTWWLTNAIHHVHATQAYQGHHQNCSQFPDTAALKRVWWACIVRDRIMLLGLHRPVLITHSSFYIEANLLAVEDLTGDPVGPAVHGQRLRHVIHILTTSLCELCALLTDILSLVYPSGTTPRVAVDRCVQSRYSIQCSRQVLAKWHCDLTYRLSQIPRHLRLDYFTILYWNILQIYY